MAHLSPVLGEFGGTFVLIVLGNGVVAGALLNRSKAQKRRLDFYYSRVGDRCIRGRCRERGMGDADGHLNPAFTVASVIMTGNPIRLVTYIPAQILGAALGAVVVWLQYMPHWELTESADAGFACFATSPAVR